MAQVGERGHARGTCVGAGPPPPRAHHGAPDGRPQPGMAHHGINGQSSVG